MGVTSEDLRMGDPPKLGAATLGSKPSDSHETESRQSRRWLPLVLSTGAYLVLSVAVWSNVWRSHPASVTTCGCGDPSFFVWFIKWPVYAITHGLNPLYSTAEHYPLGINLLATGGLGVGIVLSPITWLFGSVATLNVALTLAPVVSALAMFVLLRRWTTWAPAAFVGGLFYGFSPFMLGVLAPAWLSIGIAAGPPLIILCLDELIIRQRRRPVVIGILLGLLIAAQFIVGTEVLLITTIMGALGVGILVIYTAWRRPEVLKSHRNHALIGALSGAVTAAVLLVYPVWFAIDGPAHFTGLVWPGKQYAFQRSRRTEIVNFLLPGAVTHSSSVRAHHYIGAGYQGPVLSAQYFGFGILIVLVGGFILWRRDRRMWLFGVVGVVATAFSLGAVRPLVMPWQLLENLPVVDNIIPFRFVFVTYLAVAVLLGLIVDHTYVSVNRYRATNPDPTDGRQGQKLSRPLPRWAGAVAGIVVAGVAIVPPAAYSLQTLPFTTQPLDVPAWFQTVALHLKGHQVLLVVPPSGELTESAMLWQATDNMAYSVVGEGGPGGILQRAGREASGESVIQAAATARRPKLKPGDIGAVRQALDEWGVTMVVIPDQADLPFYDQMTSVTKPSALITAATGQRPSYRDGVWVWTGVHGVPPTAYPTAAQVSACTKGLASHGSLAVVTATKCVVNVTRRER